MPPTVEHDVEAVQNQSKKRTRAQIDQVRPCDRCRNQHLKCEFPDEAPKCKRCEKSGNECIRSKKEFQFRDVPLSELRGQKRVKKTRKSVHETLREAADAVRKHNSSQYGLVNEWLSQNAAQLQADEFEHESSFRSNDSPGFEDLRDTMNNGVRVVERNHHEVNYYQVHPEAMQSLPAVAVVKEHDLYEASHAQRCKPSSVESKQQEVESMERMRMPPDDRIYLETILMRFFREELAPWFDICDTLHHFADILPRYARQPGPLRDAILTISARYLFNNQGAHSQSDVIQWNGHLLPTLTEELAISYHNKCIAELLKLSSGQEGLSEETLLAAVVILRTDEEMMHQQEDKQLFLKVASLSIGAQLPEQLTLSYESSLSTLSTPLSSLREACLLTSIRQDIHASLLAQQAIKFPLARCEKFRALSPASDLVWANRAVVFCADVLEFCFGAETMDTIISPAFTDRNRWKQLRSREESFSDALPISFEPVCHGEPRVSHGDIFPNMFFLETIHVSGAMYLELARLLIHVFNPDKPRLGRGAASAAKAATELTKKSVLKLCGIALCNSDICPPSLVNASLGEYLSRLSASN